MDATLRKISDFSFQLSYDELPPVAIHECKRRIIDTLACCAELGALTNVTHVLYCARAAHTAAVK